jgi:hypothetical protein
VRDLEGLESGDAVLRLLPERLEIGGVDLVFALNLLDHQLRVRDDAKARMIVIERVLQAAEQARVLGVVVGAHAEEFAEFRENCAFVVLNESAVAGGPGIATGSAVAVGVDPICLLGSRGGRDGGVREEIRSRGLAGRHWVSLPDGGAK